MPPPAVDSAILEALGLDASDTTMTAHGGSGFASTFKLSSKVDGRPRHYFVKTGSGADAEVMFKGEHASLNAIADVVPDFCPRSHAHGAMTSPGTFFLATDFLDMETPSSSSSSSSSPSSSGSGSGLSLAAKLARLHTTTTTTAAARPMFGFPVPTCCGSTVQNNTWKASWADFYAENRLRGVLAGTADGELAAAVERVADEVVPRLLDERRVGGLVPVVVHGDLWSGNRARGRICGDGGGGGGAVEEVVFDPSAVYGHAEYELGIMRMIGGFGAAFWHDYHRLVPKAEPREEWEDRIALYELYHHLNHFAIFGGGFRSSAMAIIKRLIAKFGTGTD